MGRHKCKSVHFLALPIAFTGDIEVNPHSFILKLMGKFRRFGLAISILFIYSTILASLSFGASSVRVDPRHVGSHGILKKLEITPKLYDLSDFRIEFIKGYIPTKSYMDLYYLDEFIGKIDPIGGQGNKAIEKFIEVFEKKQQDHPNAKVDIVYMYSPSGGKLETIKSFRIIPQE